MHAPLFFAMLRQGRTLESRRNYRKYYELTRISAYPHYKKESQEEYAQYLWESSLSPREKEDREEFKFKLEKHAKESQVYQPSYAALQFFRGSARGTH